MTPLAASLHQRILSAVRAAIAQRELAPGSVLLEAVIADALFTSRTPVKAALESLRADGRVAKLGGRGYVVLTRAGDVPDRRIRIGRAQFASLAPATLGARLPAAWSRIYQDVESEVAGGAIHGRLRVVESEIAKAYGVSRTVAREVLSRIEKAGLIEKDDRSHWRVLPLTPERTGHIYELRRALEPVALTRSAERGGHDDARSMRERLTHARTHVDDLSPEDIQSFERELHIDLVGGCGNPEIINALRVVQVQIASNRLLFGRIHELYRQILTEHLAVADRLAANDIRGAAEALTFHLDGSKAAMIDRVAAITAASPPDLPRYLQRE